MTRSIRTAALASAVLLLAAGCGSGAGSGGTTKTSGSSTGAAHVAGSALGKIIVDGSGHALYMFAPDSARKSTCNAQCLHYWPPAAPATQLSGVTGKVGRTRTVTGRAILTVAGRPLYSYVGDQAPGDLKGQRLNLSGGEWYVVDPSGRPIKKAASSSGSGGGY